MLWRSFSPVTDFQSYLKSDKPLINSGSQQRGEIDGQIFGPILKLLMSRSATMSECDIQLWNVSGPGGCSQIFAVGTLLIEKGLSGRYLLKQALHEWLAIRSWKAENSKRSSRSRSAQLRNKSCQQSTFERIRDLDLSSLPTSKLALQREMILNRSKRDVHRHLLRSEKFNPRDSSTMAPHPLLQPWVKDRFSHKVCLELGRTACRWVLRPSARSRRKRRLPVGVPSEMTW